MKNNILLEVKRIHEIMGLQTINEQLTRFTAAGEPVATKALERLGIKLEPSVESVVMKEFESSVSGRAIEKNLEKLELDLANGVIKAGDAAYERQLAMLAKNPEIVEALVTAIEREAPAQFEKIADDYVSKDLANLRIPQSQFDQLIEKSATNTQEAKDFITAWLRKNKMWNPQTEKMYHNHIERQPYNFVKGSGASMQGRPAPIVQQEVEDAFKFLRNKSRVEIAKDKNLEAQLKDLERKLKNVDLTPFQDDLEVLAKNDDLLEEIESKMPGFRARFMALPKGARAAYLIATIGGLIVVVPELFGSSIYALLGQVGIFLCSAKLKIFCGGDEKEEGGQGPKIEQPSQANSISDDDPFYKDLVRIAPYVPVNVVKKLDNFYYIVISDGPPMQVKIEGGKALVLWSGQQDPNKNGWRDISSLTRN